MSLQAGCSRCRRLLLLANSEAEQFKEEDTLRLEAREEGEEALREGGRAAIYGVDADAASWQRAAWTSANQDFNEVQNLGEDGLVRACSALAVRRNSAIAEQL